LGIFKNFVKKSKKIFST